MISVLCEIAMQGFCAGYTKGNRMYLCKYTKTNKSSTCLLTSTQTSTKIQIHTEKRYIIKYETRRCICVGKYNLFMGQKPSAGSADTIQSREGYARSSAVRLVQFMWEGSL